MAAFLALYNIYLECLSQGVQNSHTKANISSFWTSLIKSPFSISLNFQTVSDKKSLPNGLEIHRLQASLSPAINIELQVQFNQRLHGCNIDFGRKGRQSA